MLLAKKHKQPFAQIEFYVRWRTEIIPRLSMLASKEMVWPERHAHFCSICLIDEQQF